MPQSSHRALAKPCAKMPHSRYLRKAWRTKGFGVWWSPWPSNWPALASSSQVSKCSAMDLLAGAAAAFNAQTQSEASALSALSAILLASMVVGASAAAGAVLVVPVVLSVP